MTMTMDNSNPEAITPESAIDPVLLEELRQLESEPRKTHQRFRPVYRNRPHTSTNGTQGEEEIFYITPEFDPELERNVIYWRQIEETFQNALYICDGFDIVYFNQDYDKKNFLPLRINTALEGVLNVMIEDPIDGSKDDPGPTTQYMAGDRAPAWNTNNGIKIGEDSGSVAMTSSLSTDPLEKTLGNIHEGDDFNILHCQSRKYGRGLALTKAEGGSAESQTDIGIIYLIIVEDYSKAMEWLLKAANQGYAPAQRIIGSIYVTGYGVIKNLSVSLGWAMKAAEQGDASGQNLVGKFYSQGVGGGTGVDENFPRAMEWYMKAADQGNPRAQRNVGNIYVRGHGVPSSYSKALEWFMKAAKQGNIVSHNDIGAIYGDGLGVPKNQSKALEWFQRAASQGESYSQGNIATMYYNGVNFSQDYKMALKWFLISANQGNTTSQCDLGDMYYDGIGVPQDYSKALWWYQKAAESDDSIGQASMGKLYYEGIAVTRDYDKAIEWYLKAAKQGCRAAKSRIGTIYKVRGEYSNAMEWYTELSKAGDAQFMFEVAELYYRPYSIESRDLAKAFEWYLKAAENEYVRAMRLVAYMYSEGKGVSRDYFKAIEWYLKAAHHGDPECHIEVGRIYFSGYVPLDYDKALEYFIKAAEAGVTIDIFIQELATCCLKCYGTPLDIIKAKEWTMKSGWTWSLRNITLAEKMNTYFHLNK